MDAIEPFSLAPARSSRRFRTLDLFLEMLLALAQSEHPYAYVRASDPPPRQPSS